MGRVLFSWRRLESLESDLPKSMTEDRTQHTHTHTNSATATHTHTPTRTRTRTRTRARTHARTHSRKANTYLKPPPIHAPCFAKLDVTRPKHPQKTSNYVIVVPTMNGRWPLVCDLSQVSQRCYSATRSTKAAQANLPCVTTIADRCMQDGTANLSRRHIIYCCLTRAKRHSQYPDVVLARATATTSTLSLSRATTICCCATLWIYRQTLPEFNQTWASRIVTSGAHAPLVFKCLRTDARLRFVTDVRRACCFAAKVLCIIFREKFVLGPMLGLQKASRTPVSCHLNLLLIVRTSLGCSVCH